MSPSFLDLPQREPGECIIKVGTPGTEITDFYRLLTEVTVECTRAQAWNARLKFATYRNELGRWAIEDSGVFRAWAPISVEAAFGTYREAILHGYIREIKVDHPKDQGLSSVTLECQDLSIALDREHVRKRWGKQEAPTSDRAILTEVAGRHGLSVSPSSGLGQTGLINISQDDTDIKFLRNRAQVNDYELIFSLFLSKPMIYFGPMRLDADMQDTILVYSGAKTHCMSFSTKVDAHTPDAVAFDIGQPKTGNVPRTVVKTDLHPMGRDRATSEGAGLKEFVWLMSREGGSDENELKAKAQQKVNALAMKIRAEGELDGSAYGHVLRVGEPVGVDGIGDEMSGRYYVDSVTHTFTAQGYRQRFVLLRNAFGDNLAAHQSATAGIL